MIVLNGFYRAKKWTTKDIDRYYSVISKETSLSKPETKIKLHNQERFAFGYWTGETINGQIAYNAPQLPGIVESQVIKYYAIATGETISAGDAVKQLADGTIISGVSNNILSGKIVGIALQSGSGNDSIPIQISGRITTKAYNFTSDINYVFCRTKSILETDVNVTETPLTAATLNENMYIVLGKKDSSNSFILGIQESRYA